MAYEINEVVIIDGNRNVVNAGIITAGKLRLDDGAGVLVEGFVDEDDMSSDSDLRVPTQQSVKAYTDGVGAANEFHIDNLVTLTGVPKDSQTLGTFTGTTISDNCDISGALQELETAVDSALEGLAVSVQTVQTATAAAHYLTFVDSDNVAAAQETVYTDAGIQYNPSTNILTVGEIVVSGDLTVNGTQTIVQSSTFIVEDKNIELGKVTTPTDVTADGGGITLKGATDKTFNWVDATDSWTSSENLDLASAKEYRIAGANVLDATTLGGAVVNSSLTSVGNLTDLTVTGDINANGNIVGDAATEISGINLVSTTLLSIGGVSVSANSTELNYLDGSTPGAATNSNAVVLDANQDFAGINNLGIDVEITGNGSTNIVGMNTITAAGKMYALSYTSTSDASLKTNVVEIADATDKVKAIRGVTFDWTDGSGNSAGIIAQEVEAILPSIVSGTSVKQVEYNGLVGLLVEAVKELSARIDVLEGN